MGEAKRRKELGLNPKGPKVSASKSEGMNILSTYPYLPYIVIVLIIFALIFDWTRFNLPSN